MKIKVGAVVVHPSYGVGKVVGVEDQKFSEKESQSHYVIKIENGTIWVPVEKPQAVGVRLITPGKDLPLYRDLLQAQPLPLSDDRYARRLEYKNRLKLASFETLCEIVRDLSAHGWRKKLNELDSATLHKITDNLVKEWALSAGISPNEAKNEICSILTESRHAYSPA